MALLLLVGIFFAIHPAPARADTSLPGDEMLFWCIGGRCDFPPCPEDSFLHPSTVSQLRSCSEANWAAYSQWEFGPLTFAGEKIYPGHAPQVEFDWASPNGPVADTMQAKIDDDDDGVPNPGPGKNLGNQDCGKCSGTAIGNPINLATGNKFGDETDADGAGRFPLAFQRLYNSIGAGNGPLLKAGGRRVEGRCLVDDSCRKVGPVWWGVVRALHSSVESPRPWHPIGQPKKPRPNTNENSIHESRAAAVRSEIGIGWNLRHESPVTSSTQQG
jgi:hypothetical protein